MPEWNGHGTYAGDLTHSSSYTNALPYVGKLVLVVGAGNSGTEIATDLTEHGAAFVALSIRTPPPIVRRDPFGMPVQRTGIMLGFLPAVVTDRLGRLTARIVLGDLTRYGLKAPKWLPFSAQRVPVIDVGFVRALKDGRVHVRPTLARLTATEAVFGDCSMEPFDAIIAATGFSTGLMELLGTPEVLDASDQPTARSGEASARPGLYFIGYIHSLRGHLFEANRASRRLARNVDRYLKSVLMASPCDAVVTIAGPRAGFKARSEKYVIKEEWQ